MSRSILGTLAMLGMPLEILSAIESFGRIIMLSDMGVYRLHLNIIIQTSRARYKKNEKYNSGLFTERKIYTSSKL